MARKKPLKRSNGTGTVYQRTPGAPFTAEWKGANGKPRKRSTRTTDRQAALALLEKWTTIEAKRREGLIDDAAERLAEQRKRGLSEHLDDWRKWLESTGATPRHVQHTVNVATRLLESAGVKALPAIVPSAILEAVAAMKGGKASARTKNHALGSVRALCRWAVKDGRLSANPIAGVARFNVDSDRRRVRRALSDDELRRIIDAAETGREWADMSGKDRAMLYRLAAGSGLRAGELASLTPESFSLDGDNPAVIVSAAYSKRRRDDRQPIRPDLAALLRPWLCGKRKGALVFGDRLERTAELLRFDMAVAHARWARKLPPGPERRETRAGCFLRPADEAGRVADFHALRATYITALVRGGASVKVAQTLARHSTPVLTMNTYTRLGVHDLTGALDALPDLSAPSDAPEREAVELRATGTDDGAATGSQSGRNGPAKQSAEPRRAALKLARDVDESEHENPVFSSAKRAERRGDAPSGANAPRRTRTFDPLIKSQLLYQLS